ncbi:DUF4817 domain-containing protein [Trichonephila clavipes]|nr:DUF4817 domain-containing protein [Trichonephila clavipes]
MAEYTNAEKADMILAYGATDCNGRAAQRLYAERPPVRRTPAHTMFARLHQQFDETGSFQKAARNRDRTARTELNEEIVLDMVETTPSLSTRGIANEIGISYSSVWRILDDSALHPFHYQHVQKNVTLHLVRPFHSGTCRNELQIPFCSLRVVHR